MGVCNNACWTIDELTLWMGTEAVGPYAGVIAVNYISLSLPARDGDGAGRFHDSSAKPSYRHGAPGAGVSAAAGRHPARFPR